MFKNNTAVGSERAKKTRILIATGGSGGHIFPGLAIAEKLRAEGYACTFIGYGRHFAESVRKQGFDFIMLPATQWNVPSLTKRLRALVDLSRAFIRAMVLVQRLRPAVVLGMGGYASVAAVLAGKVSGVPTAIHEQNVKPGRANLLLGRWADVVLLSFDASRAFFRRVTPQKFRVVGNPVRTQVLDLAAEPRAEDAADTFHLLVFGGSQGARVFSQVVPQMVAELSPELRTRLRITQQARAEDVNAVQEAYAKLHMTADVAPFFDDLPQRLHQAHLLIGRAGVGTVAEAAVLNRAISWRTQKYWAALARPWCWKSRTLRLHGWPQKCAI